MALTIRLRQQGRRNRHFFRMVVADARVRRDGPYLEMLGWYNPVAPREDLELLVKGDRVQFWLDQGAQLSDRAAALVKKGAPEVMKVQQDKAQVKRTELIAARRARRRAAHQVA